MVLNQLNQCFRDLRNNCIKTKTVNKEKSVVINPSAAIV